MFQYVNYYKYLLILSNKTIKLVLVMRAGFFVIYKSWRCIITRINVVSVEELCDKHLLAEHREIVRVPNTINSGKAILDSNYPKEYTLGTGHVKFFYARLKWLHSRYMELYNECLYRGFNVTFMWPESVPERLYRDYVVTEEALALNRVRIADRMPINAKFTGR